MVGVRVMVGVRLGPIVRVGMRVPVAVRVSVGPGPGVAVFFGQGVIVCVLVFTETGVSKMMSFGERRVGAGFSEVGFSKTGDTVTAGVSCAAMARVGTRVGANSCRPVPSEQPVSSRATAKPIFRKGIKDKDLAPLEINFRWNGSHSHYTQKSQVTGGSPVFRMLF